MKSTFTKIALIFILITTSFQAQASHVIGGYIKYKYLTPLTYKVSLILLQDCYTGVAPIMDSIELYYYSQSNSVGLITYLPVDTTINRPVNPCNAPLLSTCNGGFDFGLMEIVYSDTIVLPAASSDWIFAWEACCSLNSIINIQNASGGGVYFYANLDNLNYPVNSSPEYNQLLYNQYCLGNYTSVNVSCSDIDGDSIAYELSPSYDASIFTIPPFAFANPYNPPFSYLYQVQSNSPEFMDSINGMFYLTPATIGVNRFSFTVKEFRNGLLIGSASREDLLVISNYLPNPNFITGKVFNDINQNGVKNNGEPAIINRIVALDTLGSYTLTDTSGNYLFKVPSGNSYVNLPFLNSYINCNPASYIIPFSSGGAISANNNFALNYLPGLKDLRIFLTSVSSPTFGWITCMKLDYANVGTDTIFNPYIQFNPDSNLDLVFALPNSNMLSGNSLIWNFAFIAPGHIGSIILYYVVKPLVPMGTIINVSASISPIANDTFPADNFASLSSIVVQSYDPNYKEVSPSGNITPQFLIDDEWLYYTIHFQNTGSGLAYFVDVHDTLDANLDLSTFEFLSASHSCNPQLNTYGYYKIIDFVFNNILLPDSGSNEPASHGYVKYRVKPKKNLLVGNSIVNGAHIIFDNNVPVATNAVSTLFVMPNGISINTKDQDSFSLYPNPVQDALNIRFKFSLYAQCEVKVYNILGEQVYAGCSFIQEETAIPITELSPGMYFLTLKYKGQTAQSKFVKE